MKHEVNIDNFLTLIYWVKTFSTVEGYIFKHEELLEKAILYKHFNKPLDTNINDVCDLMLDAYKLYQKLNLTKEKVFSIMSSMNMPNIPNMPKISKESMIKEIEDFENIFENLLENYKFKNNKISSIQKEKANEKMKMCVEVEDYENAAKYRDLIKEY